jgi:hypothetical protein
MEFKLNRGEVLIDASVSELERATGKPKRFTRVVASVLSVLLPLVICAVEAHS